MGERIPPPVGGWDKPYDWRLNPPDAFVRRGPEDTSEATLAMVGMILLEHEEEGTPAGTHVCSDCKMEWPCPEVVLAREIQRLRGFWPQERPDGVLTLS